MSDEIAWVQRNNKWDFVVLCNAYIEREKGCRRLRKSDWTRVVKWAFKSISCYLLWYTASKRWWAFPPLMEFYISTEVCLNDSHISFEVEHYFSTRIFSLFHPINEFTLDPLKKCKIFFFKHITFYASKEYLK